MKLINTALYVEFKEMVEARALESGKPVDNCLQYLKKASSTDTKGYGFTKDPDDARCVLLAWEEMNEKNRAIISAWLRKKNSCKCEAVKCDCGNPYVYMQREPIRKTISYDRKAEAFFLAYPCNGNPIPFETVQKYSYAAGFYNAVLEAEADKKKLIKERFGMEITPYYERLMEIASDMKLKGELPAKFPTTYQRFRGALTTYKAQGYVALIHPNFGNKIAAKVSEEECENVLKGLIEHPNQYDDVYICWLYNQWAKESGYKEIKAATVFTYRKKWAPELTASREGWSAYNEKYVRQVKGVAANTMAPLMLVECDDYNLNYYYRNPELPAEKARDLQRYVSYVVADSSVGLVLGKSYRQAKAPTFDMVKLAWIDAMYYIRSLTGGWYLPSEVKADHWQRASAFPYFRNIGHFVPPALKNKHRGYIEQLFGSPHAKRAEKTAAHRELNYNGNNVTARHTGVNVEALAANAKNRPQIGNEAEQQIERFFQLMRKMPSITRDNMEAPSREAVWLERWSQLPEDKKRPINDLQFLLTFGFVHTTESGNIQITNRGVEPQIKGVKYSYDLPDYAAMQHLIGQNVSVVYDPYDMSRVLITNFKNIYFIAKQAALQPRALAYVHEGSRAALNTILSEKKTQVVGVAEKSAARKEQEGDYLDVEAIMFTGLMRKELVANIEQGYREQVALPVYPAPDNWQQQQQQYRESQVNYDEYL